MTGDWPRAGAPTANLIIIGEIVRAHGLRGEVRVRPLTDHPERFARVSACVLWDAAREQWEPRRITAARPLADGVVFGLEGCHTPEAAAALAGRLVALPREEALPLPPGQFYPWQLEGSRVVTEDGAEVGVVTGLERGPAHDLWVVRGPEREHLIPAVPAIVLDLDLSARRAVIRPPEGLLEL